MQVIPAIDLRGGQCVRLRQGDFARETVFDADPVAVARRWVELGAPALHIVDLDGAKTGRPVHTELIRTIVAAAGVPCHVGGGLRSSEHVGELFAAGAARVVLGTRALRDPMWFRDVCEEFPRQVLLGLDARDEKLATNGWLELTEESPVDVARKLARWPIAGIVYTDISRDGMMEGPNCSAYARLSDAVRVPVFASGGVAALGDIRALAKARVAGCVVGRALYEGTLELPAAIAAARHARAAAP